MERKASDHRIVVALVGLLVIEVTMLCVHLGWGGFRRPGLKREAVLAGHVVKSENELRRRGTNSLVWEKSAADDAVYFYDSILTLSQSTASLQLFKETEVKLSENTLVTIEPQDSKGYGEIRLKFTKGSFQARNPFAGTHIESESWSMEIKSGSDIEFRQVGEGDFELGVKKGEVDFKSAAGEDRVAEKQMLRINKDTAKKMNVEEGLAWSQPPPARIYTHSEQAEIKLNWKGTLARELVLQSLGAQERRWPVAEGEQSREVQLPLGKHQIFLRSGDKTSAALSVEVWKAPLLHLLSPLPRNRVPTGSQANFVWLAAPGVATYDFHLKGAARTIDQLRTENTFSTVFTEEDDAEWSVQGRDAQGFVIPPLYTYPIYLREAPLAAPKLKSPTLRQPAKEHDRGAAHWFMQLLLPSAQADEILYQAVFTWEPVEGADRYVIEISETADFRNLLVTKTVAKNEFIWKKMDLKAYYWRVAAETKRGRMGLFSDPEEVDLKSGLAGGVAVMPLEDQQSEPPPAKTVDAPRVHFGSEEPPPPPAPAAVAVEPPLEITPPPLRKFVHQTHTFVEWRALYSSLTTTAPENVRASVRGVSLAGFTAVTERVLAPERMLRLQLDYVRQNFRPSPNEKFPEQDNLKWNDISVLGVTHMNSSHLGYGVFVFHSAQITRKTLESVQVSDSNGFGPCAEGYFQFGRLQLVSDYMAVVGSQYGLVMRQNIRAPIWAESPVSMGAGIEAGALFRSGYYTYSMTGQVSLGFDF